MSTEALEDAIREKYRQVWKVLDGLNLKKKEKDDGLETTDARSDGDDSD